MRATARAAVRRWWADRRGFGADIYILAIFLIWILLAFGVTGVAIHSVEIARATMSRYVQIAAQQTLDDLAVPGAVNPQANRGVVAVASAGAVQPLFSQQLAQQLAEIPAWAHLPVSVVQVQWYTQADAGQPAPPGVPGGVIPGAGLYAVVQFPWDVGVPGLSPFTVTVPEWMSASSLGIPQTGSRPQYYGG